jgi:hypothetical protein
MKRSGIGRLGKAERRPNTAMFARSLCWVIASLDPAYEFPEDLR